MPRTRTTAKKVSGGKAPRKQTAQASPVAGSSTSSAAKRTRSSGVNPVQTRPTPKWQKPITGFGKAARAEDGDEKNGHDSGLNGDANNGTEAEDDAGPSHKKAKLGSSSGSGAAPGNGTGSVGKSSKVIEDSEGADDGTSSSGDESGSRTPSGPRSPATHCRPSNLTVEEIVDIISNVSTSNSSSSESSSENLPQVVNRMMRKPKEGDSDSEEGNNEDD